MRGCWRRTLKTRQRLASNHEDLEQTLRDTNASPVVNLVNRILLQALQLGASDIHVEPQQIGLQVRFRQDGVLQSYIEPLPSRLVPAVTSRFKIMADLDIAERRQAQDGRIRKFRDRTVDFRVNSLPSRFGEKSCSAAGQLLHPAGARQTDHQSGGPGAGAGAWLQTLRNDPGHRTDRLGKVDHPLFTAGGTQRPRHQHLHGGGPDRIHPSGHHPVPGEPGEGLRLRTALRAFMRQDPDVLLVGETRDLETAKTAIEAALTGHLVLTTLHCNDAPSAIARLGEMGVEPFMVSASLIGIVSQRLLRKVCSHCRQSYQPDATELARFGLMSHHESQCALLPRPPPRRTGEPCPHCQGSGYQGRIGSMKCCA